MMKITRAGEGTACRSVRCAMRRKRSAAALRYRSDPDPTGVNPSRPERGGSGRYTEGMFGRLVSYFDKLEDRILFRLSRYPILYALVGAIGIVLVWKGVWEVAASFSWLHGAASFLLGTVILLLSGLLVSFFIGDSILISGFRREKKLMEKAESEVHSEKEILDRILARVERIEKELLEPGSSSEKSIE